LPEARQRILDTIGESSEPVKAALLAKSVGLKIPVVKELLAPDAASGSLFNWGTDKAPAYWRKGPSDIARERLLTLAATESLTPAQLSQQASRGQPKLKPAAIKSAQAELLAEKRLHLIEKKLLDDPHLDAWLELTIAELLKKWGREQPADRVRALLADTPRPSSAVTVADTAEKIFAAMNRIAFSPGATVTFYRLRRQPELAQVPKPIFDEAALLLQRDRRALLSLHGHASALPPEERETLVADGSGAYYVSIYAR
jgi:hypothetical protein